ncbi:MAG TPA: acyltransferase [Cyclobacteriaceae bacterium]|nr:acyltransferase [Cyclobacteriaceae bacterium]
MATDRLGVLDGFRCVAIVSVVSYHYCYRFTIAAADKNYLPFYEFSPFFSHGYYGVQFFFVISGFVIFRTLSRTRSPLIFAEKRAIRLLPSLLLCSLLTFAFVSVIDHDYALPFFHINTLLSFIPSITMTPPILWNFLFERNDIGYIDGAYWSLFTEGFFYLFGALIYFRQPSRFVQNWIVVTLLLNILRVLTSPKLAFFFPAEIDVIFAGIYRALFLLTFTSWIYFALGIFFYTIFMGEKPSAVTTVALAMSTILEFYFLGDNILRLLFLIIIALFAVMVYRPHWLNFLRERIFTQIGLASYPLYLLHENIGVLLIHRLGTGLGTALTFVVTVLVMIFLILLSKFLHEKYERPCMEFLSRRLINKS